MIGAIPAYAVHKKRPACDQDRPRWLAIVHETMTPLPPPSAAVLTCLRDTAAPSLEAFFAPRSVALIGATDREGSVGRAVLMNLQSFPGNLFSVNPKRAAVLGLRAYATLSEIEGSIDLVIIVTPALSVPVLIRECVDKGVKAVVVISAGFRDRG